MLTKIVDKYFLFVIFKKFEFSAKRYLATNDLRLKHTDIERDKAFHIDELNDGT